MELSICKSCQLRSEVAPGMQKENTGQDIHQWTKKKTDEIAIHQVFQTRQERERK
jgi:hypothetical protein